MILRELRYSKSITQKQLATAICKDRTYIAKLETKKSKPSVTTAKALGEYFGVEWTIFFED